jgi:predicted outer membrane lipoprotein
MVCSNCLIYCLVCSHSRPPGVPESPEYNLLWLPVIWCNPSLPPMIPEQLQKPPENKMVCSNCLIYCLVHSYSWLLGVLNPPEYNLLWLPVIWFNPSLPPMIPEQLRKAPENKMVCSNCLIYCLVHSYSWLLGVLNSPEYNLLWLPVIWSNPSLPPMIPEQLRKAPENKMVCSNWLMYCLVHSYSWILGVLNSPEYNLLWLPVI